MENGPPSSFDDQDDPVLPPEREDFRDLAALRQERSTRQRASVQARQELEAQQHRRQLRRLALRERWTGRQHRTGSAAGRWLRSSLGALLGLILLGLAIWLGGSRLRAAVYPQHQLSRPQLELRSHQRQMDRLVERLLPGRLRQTQVVEQPERFLVTYRRIRVRRARRCEVTLSVDRSDNRRAQLELRAGPIQSCGY